MDEEKEILKYKTFTFEEFLSDDYFIATFSNPNEYSESFWSHFVESKPNNLEEYKLAFSFLEMSQNNPTYLSLESASLLWDKISTTNASPRKNEKSYYLMAITVAASIALFLMFPFNNFFKDNQSTTDLVNYAHNLPELPYTEETQLIVANNKIIMMEEKESTVNYETSNIKTQKEEISKSDLSEYNQIITPKGKRSVLTLQDGSKIWINSGSRVVYPKEFNNKSREIYVEGEVFVNVTKDENRPFNVHTSKMNVRVLGTSFNISAYADETEQYLALVTGSVQIELNSKTKTILKPNQLFTSAGEKYLIQSVDVSSYISWIDGFYKFEGASLSKVFEKLSKYYGKEIICNSKIKDIRCSGSLDLKDDLQIVLEDLSFMVAFEIKQENEKYIIVELSK